MKEQLLQILNHEWKATARIAMAAGLNYYDVFDELVRMNNQEEIERLIKGRRHQMNFWRLARAEQLKPTIEHEPVKYPVTA